MSSYLFLFRGGVSHSSPEEMQKHMQKWRTWIDGLRTDGRFLAGEPLEHPSSRPEGWSRSAR